LLAYQSTQQARAKHHDEALRAAPVLYEGEADHVEEEVKPAATSAVRPKTVSVPDMEDIMYMGVFRQLQAVGNLANAFKHLKGTGILRPQFAAPAGH
jgi:hypothetical protein